jgi:molybdopterin molybdotransferase
VLLALDVENYTPVDDALHAVRRRMRVESRTEVIPSAKSLGRVCARDVVSPVDVPPFDTSQMDGIAVIAGDMEGATGPSPKTLKVVGELRLGSRSGPKVAHGQAVRVATGSKLPLGADAVLPAEQVKAEGGLVRVGFMPEPGRFVFKKGNDIRKGEVVLGQGTVVRAQHIGLMRGLGIDRVGVRERPRVAVLATGSELTDAAKPGAGKVRDSHSPFFLSLLGQLGCVPVGLGIVEDDPSLVSRAIRRGLARADFVLTLGGTSAGRADVVEKALATLKPEVLIHGIRMDRGRVSGVSVVGGKPVLMMPGPIQGAMNAFVLFAVPIIGWLTGAGEGIATELPCRLGGGWEARRRFPDFTKVLYVKLREGSRTVADPLQGETESFKILAEADGYVIVPEDVTNMVKGDPVLVRLLPGFSFA